MEDMSAGNENTIDAYKNRIDGIMAEFSRVTTVPVVRDDRGLYAFESDFAGMKRSISALSVEFLMAAVESSVRLMKDLEGIHDLADLESAFLGKEGDLREKIDLLKVQSIAVSGSLAIAAFCACALPHIK